MEESGENYRPAQVTDTL